MEEEILNVCCICREPILNTWFHAQGMRCGKKECEEKFIEIFINRKKDK